MTTTTAIQTADLPLPALPNPNKAAIDRAGALLSHLAPLYPVIASATRTAAGADAWIAAWARQIEMAGLTQRQIVRGITRLARGEHDPDTPLSWSVFYRLCIDPFRDLDDWQDIDPAERERKMRELQARYPGARFTNL